MRHNVGVAYENISELFLILLTSVERTCFLRSFSNRFKRLVEIQLRIVAKSDLILGTLVICISVISVETRASFVQA